MDCSTMQNLEPTRELPNLPKLLATSVLAPPSNLNLFQQLFGYCRICSGTSSRTFFEAPLKPAPEAPSKSKLCRRSCWCNCSCSNLSLEHCSLLIVFCPLASMQLGNLQRLAVIAQCAAITPAPLCPSLVGARPEKWCSIARLDIWSVSRTSLAC